MNKFLRGGRELSYDKGVRHLSNHPTKEKNTSDKAAQKADRKRSKHISLYTLPMIIFCVLFSNAFAQSAGERAAVKAQVQVEPVLVGHKVPDEFWTKEHLFYANGDTVRRTLEDYKGKILVLDFWATWCANCIGSMKKTQELFAKYPEDALVLFVNPAHTKDNYTKILAKQDVLETNSLNGSFTSIIEDELIQQLFPNHIYPRYVWISPFGNLMAQTSALSVTDGHLTDMINILKQFHGKE